MSGAATYDFGVYIGRFQPPHDAHLAVMLEALGHVGTLVVVVGSAHAPRTLKNPFTEAERETMIARMLLDAGVPAGRVRFVPVRDHPDDDDPWLAAVRAGVAAHAQGGNVALVGHVKDDSSYYLRSFPEWPFVPTHVRSPLSATDVRAAYFSGNMDAVKGMVPPAVRAFLEGFERTAEFTELRARFLASR